MRSSSPGNSVNRPRVTMLSCPICECTSAGLAVVERRPGIFEPAVCPNCRCYSREMLIWMILDQWQEVLGPRKMSVLEVGGAARFGRRARRRYLYRNADCTETRARCDFKVVDGNIRGVTPYYDIGILSFVLSEILHVGERQNLLRSLKACLRPYSHLILFDDIDLALAHHLSLSEQQYFHGLRLGRLVLSELRESGWSYVVVESISGNLVPLQSDVPFLLCQPSDRAPRVISSLSLDDPAALRELLID